MATAVTLNHPATVTLFASAARTATATGTTQYNNEAKGIILTVLSTAVTATPVVTPKIQYSPDNGTTWIDYLVITTAIGTAANFSYLIYPVVDASADGAMTESFSLPLPRVWRLVLTHGDADSITYSVIATYL